VSVPAFDVGDKIRLGNHAGDNPDETTRAAFTDVTGTAADPTTVVLEILKPSGTTLTYNYPTQGAGDGLLTKETTGRYYRDLSLDTAGLWHWTLSGTGTVETSEQGAFYVRRQVT
jgi:hypothetical protein